MAVYKAETQTKDGRSYYFKINYKDVFGITKTYKSKKFKTKHEAQYAESDFKISIGAICSNQNITICDAYRDYIHCYQSEIKPQTLLRLNNLYKHIIPLENVKLMDLNVQHIRVWSNYLEKKELSPDYMNKIQGLFIRIINHSYINYNTPNHIIKFFKKYKTLGIKREMDFYTYDEFKKFLSVIEDKEDINFFTCLYYLGLRQGELQALTFKDIDFDNRRLYINKTLTTKIAGKEYYISSPKTKHSTRTLPLNKFVFKALEEQKEIYSKYKDYSPNWFVFGGPRPFKETTVQFHKNEYCKKANLRQIRIHDFRHSCASFLINNGASITLVSKYLGHSNISITLDTYTHLYKSELDSLTLLIDSM